jgi:hypothetical protein
MSFPERADIKEGISYSIRSFDTNPEPVLSEEGTCQQADEPKTSGYTYGESKQVEEKSEGSQDPARSRGFKPTDEVVTGANEAGDHMIETPRDALNDERGKSHEIKRAYEAD